MFWFKNLMTYRLTQAVDFSNLEEQLKQAAFTPCSKSDVSKFGWSTPLFASDSLCFRQGSNILLVSHKEEKILPAHVVNKKAEERIKALEEKEQCKLKKTEKQAIKDDVTQELLIHAFSKDTFTAAWIDEANKRIYVDSSSSKRAEDTLALLRKTLGSLPVVPLSFALLPSEVMTKWVADSTPPDWLNLLEEAELKSFDTASQVRCKHQDLETHEIEQHLQAGKFVTKLAVEWENHLSCTIDESGAILKIKFTEDVRDKNDDILKEDVAQRFDADFFLMAEELSTFMKKLIDEFGGIKERI
ncbi:recombination-associated protein RdgC [Actinobacillus pleuropneumoniae]|uniref:Recombination-associated protein RdgC n=1 Tax=Actinobacillus pleuropneumoniae serotype 5b (strain L20) TaxID=416269 RepID=A3MZL2_ACTP2|nr:recombination-associated protein RdgC [Actinobacillus pleuropneumoniae]ABN73598.1 Recombination-associated protein RdgC [Actinobacillus pleuropneumoniae serovar 5b str. L20]